MIVLRYSRNGNEIQLTLLFCFFPDAIETSVISGFNGSSNSLTGTPDATGMFVSTSG